MSRDSSPVSDHEALPKPWYRQFWPWFIIALPASAVTAGIVTLSIAMNNADDVVMEDWYREGRAINRHVELDRQAATLGIAATIENTGHGVAVTLTSRIPLPWPDSLMLSLRHPTMAERDRSFALTNLGDGRYFAADATMPTGDWHLSLSAGKWRLLERVGVTAEGTVRMGSLAP